MVNHFADLAQADTPEAVARIGLAMTVSPTRRTFLAGLLATSLPRPGWADVGSPAFLAAGKAGDGHVLHGLRAAGKSPGGHLATHRRAEICGIAALGDDFIASDGASGAVG